MLDPLAADEQRRCAVGAPGLAPWVPDPLRTLVAPQNASGAPVVAGAGSPGHRQTKTLRCRGPRVGTHPGAPRSPPPRPSVPLHRHFAQQEQWPSRRPSDPTGGVGQEIGFPVGQQGP